MTESSPLVVKETHWGIQYDDGDTDVMGSRSACVEALAAIQAGIDRGEYREDDYGGRSIVKRTVTTTTSHWEPA